MKRMTRLGSLVLAAVLVASLNMVTVFAQGPAQTLALTIPHGQSLSAVVLNDDLLLDSGSSYTVTYSGHEGTLPQGLALRHPDAGVAVDWNNPIELVGTVPAGTESTGEFTLYLDNAVPDAMPATFEVACQWRVHKCYLRLASNTLPPATLGRPYRATLSLDWCGAGAADQELNFILSHESPALPAGLSLDPATGVISGTPTAAGSVTLQILASAVAGLDSPLTFHGQELDANVSLTVRSSSSSDDSGGSDSSTALYFVDATADVGGSISPSGKVPVNERDNLTLRITAQPGYAIGQVLVDGKDVGAVESYKLENVSKNHTVKATFFPVEMPAADTVTQSPTAGEGNPKTGASEPASGLAALLGIGAALTLGVFTKRLGA